MDFDSPTAAQKAVTALKASGVQAQMAKVRPAVLSTYSSAGGEASLPSSPSSRVLPKANWHVIWVHFTQYSSAMGADFLWIHLTTETKRKEKNGAE